MLYMSECGEGVDCKDIHGGNRLGGNAVVDTVATNTPYTTSTSWSSWGRPSAPATASAWRLGSGPAAIKGMGESSQLLTIGFNAVTLGERAAEVLLPFQKAHPNTEIRPCKHSLTKLMERLSLGQVDIVFTNQFEARTRPGVRYTVTDETWPCVYLPKRHRLAKRERLTPKDLLGERVLCAC